MRLDVWIDPESMFVGTCHHPAALSVGDIEELKLQDVLAVVDQYPPTTHPLRWSLDHPAQM